jgi:hypothetical protein
MTYYEKILSFDIEEMAEFIYGVIATTEEEMLASVSRQGYEVSLVRVAPALRIAENLQRLMEEVDNGDT